MDKKVSRTEVSGHGRDGLEVAKQGQVCLMVAVHCQERVEVAGYRQYDLEFAKHSHELHGMEVAYQCGNFTIFLSLSSGYSRNAKTAFLT